MRSTQFNEGIRPAGFPERRPAAGRAQLPALRPSQNLAVPRLAPSAARLPQHEAGELFQRIRQMAGLSLLQIAHRLRTTVAVIDALERGDVERLPPWPETVVVVSGFTAMAGVDPRPVLAAIRDGLSAKVIEARPVAAHTRGRTQQPEHTRPRTVQKGPSDPVRALPHIKAVRQSVAGIPARLQMLVAKMAPLAARSSVFAKVPALNRPLRMPVAVSLAVTLPLALVVSFGGGGSLQAAVSGLPSPLSSAVRKVEDYMLRSMAVEKNGMTWIEVSDPRSRKTDKLPSPRR
jgi:transcriptional regulator with XRE-family HTH domain